ncbi:MAG: hypothetical protein M3R15_07955 [Acidobacteriota bacterium]|nr:hypothetical protein [Acidobacteriota bacterium]
MLVDSLAEFAECGVQVVNLRNLFLERGGLTLIPSVTNLEQAEWRLEGPHECSQRRWGAFPLFAAAPDFADHCGQSLSLRGGCRLDLTPVFISTQLNAYQSIPIRPTRLRPLHLMGGDEVCVCFFV